MALFHILQHAILSLFYDFIYYLDCAGSSRLCGLFSGCNSRSYSPVAEHGLQGSGVGTVTCGLSSRGSQTLGHRLNGCARAQLLCGVWNLPRSGAERWCPALAGGFFTTEPPGKPFPSLFVPGKLIPPDFLLMSLIFLLSLRSVQFSGSVVSDSLPPHGLQHARPPCPLPTSGLYSNSCPLSQ